MKKVKIGGIAMKYYLAVDLGASSGRHIVGYEKDGSVVLEEVYRFPNGMKNRDGRLVWDTDEIFGHVKRGIALAIERYGKIESMSIDSWGVDYVLLCGDEPIYPHYAYRDERTKAAAEAVHAIIPFEELYAKTGIQFQAFNTVYQLYDDKLNGRLDNATDFLMIPEYLEYLLTGNKVKEYTDATTGALVNLETGEFDLSITEKLGLPAVLFKKLAKPGAFVGNFKPEIQAELGGNIPVIACASHDTASAYEAVDCPIGSMLLSSGTWSLIGVKIPKANASQKSLESNFSNEGGNGYFRYLKNIMGMWLVNNVKKEQDLSFEQIFEAVKSSDYAEIFDVNDETLVAPDNMSEAIVALLKKSGKKAPSSVGDLFNSVFHSLAYSYGEATRNIERNLQTTIDAIYVIGGGAKNEYLNALTEKYSGKKVVANPIEATALGNIKIQMRV